jgi:acetylornithine deacetylase
MMQRLGQAHKAVSGKEPVYSPVTCTTDVRFFELYYGIPATCYGPEATNIHGYHPLPNAPSEDQQCGFRSLAVMTLFPPL